MSRKLWQLQAKNLTRLRVDQLEDRLTPAVTFAVIGDFGLGGSIYDGLNEIVGAAEPEEQVAQLVQSWNPDFLTTLGDNNYLFGENSDANIIVDIELLVGTGKISAATGQFLIEELAALPFLPVTVTGGSATNDNTTITFPTGTNFDEVAVGQYVIGTAIRPIADDFPFFTTVAAIDTVAGTITLSIPADQTIANQSYHFLPADLSIDLLDGQSHIDRNIGRYFGNFIYPYTPTSALSPNQSGGPINTGQFGNGSPTGFNRMFPVPGNHDWADILSDNTFLPEGFLVGLTGNQLDAYLNYFGPALSAAHSPGFQIGYTIDSMGVKTDLADPYFYSFTAGTTATGQPLVEFFAFDSELADPLLNTEGLSGSALNAFTNVDTIQSPQGRWLQDAMANSTALWKIPYFHHTPYTSSGDEAEEGLDGAWMRLPFQAWGADAVMYGHVHSYERMLIADPAIPALGLPAGTVAIPYIMNGAGGAPLTPFLGPIVTGSQLRYNGDYGAQRVTVDENKIDFEFYARSGALIDDYTLFRGDTTSPRVATVGQAIQFSVEFPTAVQNPSWQYSLINPPAGATIAPFSGLITWVPTAAGDTTFTVKFANPLNAAESQTLSTTLTAYDALAVSPSAPAYSVFPNTASNPLVLTATDSANGFVRVFDYTNSVERFRFQPYGNFNGGIRIAIGDVNADGVPDIITGPGPGGGPNVRVFSGVDASMIQNFFAFDPSFTGGVFVEAGDLLPGGGAEIVATAGPGGGPIVTLFQDGAAVNSFFAFGSEFRGGLRVAIGDVSNDGVDDVIVTAGPGGGARIAGFDGTTVNSPTPTRLFGDFFAFDSNFRTGFDISVGDLTGDGFADIFVSAGSGGGPRINIFDGKALVQTDTPTLTRSFFAGDPNSRNGRNIVAFDLDGDDQVELMTAAASGGDSLVSIYNPRTSTLLDSFFAADEDVLNGVNVG